MLPTIANLQFPSKSNVFEKNRNKIQSFAKYNFEEERLEYENGRPVFVYNGITELGLVEPRKEALIVWIEKILKTEKDSYSIYEKIDDGEHGYGTDFYKYRGHLFQNDVLKPLFAEEFKRAMKKSDEIIDVINIDVSVGGIAQSKIITSGQLIRGKNSFFTSQEV